MEEEKQIIKQVGELLLPILKDDLECHYVEVEAPNYQINVMQKAHDVVLHMKLVNVIPPEVTDDYYQTQNFIQKVAQTLLKDLPATGFQLYLFYDHYQSTMLECINTFSPKQLHNMLHIVMTLQYSHVYCDRGQKALIFEFDNTKTILSHSTIEAPEWYRRKWCRFKHASPNHEDKRLFMFENASGWNNWTSIGVFHGLSRVKSEIRQKQLEWCHCFCPDTEQLFDFHYKLGKMSQNQTHATETYTTRVAPLILKCLENENKGEGDEIESQTMDECLSTECSKTVSTECSKTTHTKPMTPRCPISTNNKFSHLMVENSE